MPKILIVNADKMIGSIFNDYLKKYGFDAVHVTNCEEAEFLLSIDKFNAILLEPFPELESKKPQLLVEHLKENFDDTAIIIISASNISDACPELINQSDAYLSIPIAPSEIARTLINCIGGEAKDIKMPKEDPKKNIRIFISYAKEDITKAHAIYELLLHNGYNPWIDVEFLLPGQEWEVEISRAIDASHFFIGCFSNSSVTKEGYVQKELKLALDFLDKKPESAIYLIPLRLENCTIPNKFNKLHWCDIFNSNGAELLLKTVQYGCDQRQLL